MKRQLSLAQTAGFSVRNHKHYMKKSHSNTAMLKIMNRPFQWWQCYRYQQNPAFNAYNKMRIEII